ncbi:unnamed protein product, partial [Scytosiphon promiscuus]
MTYSYVFSVPPPPTPRCARLLTMKAGDSGGGRGPEQDSPSPLPPPPPPLAFLDVPYFEGEGACADKHRLDVYIPSAPFPRPRSRTCLFVHGGSWQRGDRRHPAVPDQFYGNVGRAFAAKGLVGLVMSYRLAPGVQHPEQVRDVARAIRWARDNVSQYGGDGEDLVLVGHSAGAHLAALCLADSRWLEEAGVIAGGAEGSAGGGVPPTGSGSDAGATVVAGAGGATAAGADAGTPGNAAPAGAPAGAGAGSGGAGPAAQKAPPPPPPPPVPPTAPNLTTPARVVSGFVGISGVYDIPRMAGNVLGGVLARTAFGDDRRAWHGASPVHRVRAAARAGVGVGSGGGGRGTDRAGERSGEPVDRRGGDASGSEARTTAMVGAGAAKEGALRASAAETGACSADGRSGGSSSSSRSICPLLSAEVLLLTAASDFHLEEDADALMDALERGNAGPGDRSDSRGSDRGGGADARIGGSVRHVRLEGE